MSRESVPQQPDVMPVSEESPVIRAQNEFERTAREANEGNWEGSSEINRMFLEQIMKDLPKSVDSVRLAEAKRRLAYLSRTIEGTFSIQK